MSVAGTAAITELWAKVKAYVQQAVAAAGNVPTGGTTGQVLAKASNADNDVQWDTLTYSDVGAAASSHSHAISDVTSLQTSLDGKAPTSHASSATTYGKGTSGNYGHVKLSDATNGTAAAASGGTAATPKAVSDALAAAKTYADAYDPSGVYLKRQPSGTSELPQDSSTTEGFPIVLSDSFTNNGVISYMTKANFKTYLGYGTAANAASTDFAAATHYHTGVRSSASADALHRAYLTTSKNFRIDERASTSADWALFGYAAVGSQAPSDSGYKAANKVFATPNGSSGLPSMRALVREDLPNCWTGTKGDTSYWGLVNPDGATTGWVRTTASGLLPAASGGSSSSLGTSGWPFTNMYAANVYQGGKRVETVDGYSWVSGTTPTFPNISTSKHTAVATAGWTYDSYTMTGAGYTLYHAFAVVKVKNIAVTTARGNVYVNGSNLYIQLPVAAKAIKCVTFGSAMGGGELGLTFLSAGTSAEWRVASTTTLYDICVRLSSPVSLTASTINNDNQYIPVDVWFTSVA